MAFDDTPHEPNIPLSKKLGYSIAGGFIITLLTSILPNNTAIGASNSGYPFPWLSQPLYPIGSPPTIIWEALAIDTFVWVFAVFVIILVYQMVKSR
jgi:hypothetical protein